MEATPMYIKDFRQRYAKCVRTFCKSVPSVLQVTTDEIDTYFRSCALYLWTHSVKPDDIFLWDPAAIHRFQGKIYASRDWRSDQLLSLQPRRSRQCPGFFLRMLAFDKESDTDTSRRFTEVQREILAMCAEGIMLPSSLDGRRMAWLNEQLTIICDEEEIGPNGSRGEKEPLDKETKEAVEKEVEETMAEVRALFESIEREKQIQENDEREGTELNTGKEG